MNRRNFIYRGMAAIGALFGCKAVAAEPDKRQEAVNKAFSMGVKFNHEDVRAIVEPRHFAEILVLDLLPACRDRHGMGCVLRRFDKTFNARGEFDYAISYTLAGSSLSDPEVRLYDISGNTADNVLQCTCSEYARGSHLQGQWCLPGDFSPETWNKIADAIGEKESPRAEPVEWEDNGNVRTWYYEAGNYESHRAALEAAKAFTRKTNLIVPRFRNQGRG